MASARAACGAARTRSGRAAASSKRRYACSCRRNAYASWFTLAYDRSEIRSYRRQRPLATDSQAIVARELERDPDLTRAEIARRMRPPMHLADLDRAFGYAPAKGRQHPWRHISVAMGSRLMIALGRAPHELEGC